MIDKTSDPLEAIKIAIRREQEAHDFYKEHADLFENEATKKMFMFLAVEEMKHKIKLQDELDKNYLYEM
jgi:rubrerythrin